MWYYWAMEPLIFLEYVGTFAFASFGAYLAERKGYDIFGILSVACISALGGGTVRALLLDELPVYFLRYSDVFVVLLGVVFAVILYRHFEKLSRAMLAVDAVGLVAFAYSGASHAGQAGLGFFAIVISAVLTAVGGGVLRDVVMRETPLIFYQDFYATIAFLVGTAYFLLGEYIETPSVVYLLLLIALLLRLLSIRFNIQLWKPNRTSAQSQPPYVTHL